MRLIRLMLTLAVIGGVAYIGLTVPLGQKTLWGHLKAIVSSRESQELVDGVKQKAVEVIEPDGGSRDRLTDEERRLLRKLIREKLKSQRAPTKTKRPAAEKTKGPPAEKTRP